MEAFNQPPSNYTFAGSDRSIGGLSEEGSPLKPGVGAVRSSTAVPATVSAKGMGEEGRRMSTSHDRAGGGRMSTDLADGKSSAASQLILGAGGLESAILASEQFVESAGAMATTEWTTAPNPKNGPNSEVDVSEKQKTDDISMNDQSDENKSMGTQGGVSSGDAAGAAWSIHKDVLGKRS